MVKGLGLTSATMLVMGSMIGSGIFIVSAEIAREVDSPALLIGAWAVAGFMTIVAALSYGELAAMMPRAGGQYVYLREALGPLWGFLYGWTLFLVIQTGTIAAVGVAFGKFLGVFFPVVSSSHWILHLWKVPPIRLGPMVLGNMDVGINTQNLVAILLVVFLSVVNIFGVKTGALIQNIFTAAKVSALLGLALFGLALGRNAQALAANFSGHFWRNAGLSAQHAVQVGVGGPVVMVGTLTILAVAQVGSLFSADAWNNVTFTAGEVKNPSRNLPLSLALGTGVVIALYIACNMIYLNALPLDGTAGAATILGRGIKYASEDRVAHRGHDADVRGRRRTADGGVLSMISSFGCNNGLILSGARVYYAMAKDGLFFRSVAKLHPTYKTPAVSLMVQMVWTCVLCVSGSYGQLARLHYLRGAGVLHSDHCRIICAAADASGCPAALPRGRLSGAAGDLYCDGFVHRCRTIALQTAIHVAGADCRAAGNPGLLRVVEKRGRKARIGVAAKEKRNEWQICWQPSR